jgi:hypothetical protein
MATRPVKPKAATTTAKRQAKPKTLADVVKVTEDDVQEAIVSAAQVMGMEVLITSRRRKNVKCPGCGDIFRPTGGDGVSKGVPDLLVRHPKWPPLTWLGVEVKGPTTKVSPEQQALAAKGAVCVVRCIDDFLTAVRPIDQLLRSEEYDPLLRMTGGKH